MTIWNKSFSYRLRNRKAEQAVIKFMCVLTRVRQAVYWLVVQPDTIYELIMSTHANVPNLFGVFTHSDVMAHVFMFPYKVTLNRFHHLRSIGANDSWIASFSHLHFALYFNATFVYMWPPFWASVHFPIGSAFLVLFALSLALSLVIFVSYFISKPGCNIVQPWTFLGSNRAVICSVAQFPLQQKKIIRSLSSRKVMAKQRVVFWLDIPIYPFGTGIILQIPYTCEIT